MYLSPFFTGDFEGGVLEVDCKGEVNVGWGRKVDLLFISLSATIAHRLLNLNSRWIALSLGYLDTWVLRPKPFHSWEHLASCWKHSCFAILHTPLLLCHSTFSTRITYFEPLRMLGDYPRRNLLWIRDAALLCPPECLLWPRLLHELRE